MSGFGLVHAVSRHHRRGVALLMALFALVVGAGSATAFLNGRSEIVQVGANLRDAAKARAAATEGLSIAREVLAAIFTEPDANLANAWRTQLSDGVLLDHLELNGATLHVTIEDLSTGLAPTVQTTEFEAHVTVVVGGTSYAMTAQLSLASLVKGQYALFANKFMTMEGENFIGRWEKAPSSVQKNPVNIGTQADLQNWGFTGIYINGSAYFENEPVTIPGGYGSVNGAISSQPSSFQKAGRTGAAIITIGGAQHVYTFAGGNPLDDDNWTLVDPYEYDKSCFLYYPYQATNPTIWGDGEDKVAKVRLPQGESIRMIDPPTEPAFTTGTVYSTSQTWSGQTKTVTPFRCKSHWLLGQGDLTIKNNSTVTFTSGVYRVDDKFKVQDSRIIIDGNVKIVAKASYWFDFDAKSMLFDRATVEIKPNSQLLLFVAYDIEVDESWMGSYQECATAPAGQTVGDPHRRLWMAQYAGQSAWQASDCAPYPPTEPAYMEPWRLRIYPDPGFLSSIFIWDFDNTSLIGSVFMPTNPVFLRGNTQVYGRIAANHVRMLDQSSFFYDHAMDDISGLTEGAPPPRGGSQSVPTRIQVDF